jgi:hypothetical protein
MRTSSGNSWLLKSTTPMLTCESPGYRRVVLILSAVDSRGKTLAVEALFELDLPVGRMAERAGSRGGLGWRERGVAFGCGFVGVLDGAQPGGDAGFAGGDGLAVASTVGVFRQAGAEQLDFADVGFAFFGVRGDGEEGDARRGRIQNDSDGAGFGVMAGQGGDPGSVGLGPGWPGRGGVVPGLGVQAGEHEVGAVDLVARGGEVLPDGAQVGAAGGAVGHEPGGLGLVRVAGGAGVAAQLGLQVRADRAGADEVDQAAGEVRGCGRAASQIARRYFSNPKRTLTPFAIYCLVAGLAAFIYLSVR